jgi:hypothetical protein
MKMSHIFVSILFVAVVMGCGTYITNVNYDYDRGVDFDALETYDWMSIQTRSGEEELALKRVQYDVNSQLGGRGLKMTSSGPDFLIAVQFSKQTKVEYRNHSSSSRHSYHSNRTFTWEEGTLVLEFVDGKSDELIWRAVAEGVLAETPPSPEQRDKTVSEVVSRMLKNFPPTK